MIFKYIKLKKAADKGLQKMAELSNDIIEAQTSNLTSQEKEIYSDWQSEIKKEYDKIETSAGGWTEEVYDSLFKETYPKIDSLIMNKYHLEQDNFDKIIDIGDVISAKQISKEEIEILNRLDEMVEGDFKSKIQVAKEFNIPFYKVDQAIKKSTINLTISLFE